MTTRTPAGDRWQRKRGTAGNETQDPVVPAAMPPILQPPRPGDAYNVRDVLTMLSFSTRGYGDRAEHASAEALFCKRFESQARTLGNLVAVTNTGVVHGHGVVTRCAIAEGTMVADPAAVFMSGTLDEQEHSEHYIKLHQGFVKIHCFALDPVRKTATTFFMNEARGGAPPNVAWRIEHDSQQGLPTRKLLCWKVPADGTWPVAYGP